MKRIAIEEIAQVNPKIEYSSKKDNMPVTFLPMDAVSEKGVLNYQKERILADVVKGYTYFQEGDVLLAKITPCMENGKAVHACNLKYQIGFGSTEFHVLRAGEKVDSCYLFYMIWNPIFRKIAEKNMTGTAGQKRVPVDFLKKYKIPLPPLTEQKRIAAILDKADAVRKKRQKSIRLLDEFLQSVFLEMFGDPVKNEKGWEAKSLEELSSIISGVTKGRKLVGNEIITLPYLRVANVQDGYIDIKDIKTIEVYAYEQSKYQLIDGDLLLTEGGDPDKLGRGSVWHNEIQNCIHQNHIFRVRTNKKILNPEYLSKLIGSLYGKNYFLRSAKQTTGIATINSRQLKCFPVLLPPLSLQNQFARIVEETEQQRQLFEKSLTEMDNYFNSLMQKAFRGEL